MRTRVVGAVFYNTLYGGPCNCRRGLTTKLPSISCTTECARAHMHIHAHTRSCHTQYRFTSCFHTHARAHTHTHTHTHTLDICAMPQASCRQQSITNTRGSSSRATAGPLHSTASLCPCRVRAECKMNTSDRPPASR